MNVFERFTYHDYIAQNAAEVGAQQGGVVSGQFLYTVRAIIITHRHGASHGKGHGKADEKHDNGRQPWFSYEHGRA